MRSLHDVTRRRNYDPIVISMFRDRILRAVEDGVLTEAPRATREYVSDNIIFGAFDYEGGGLIIAWFADTEQAWTKETVTVDEANNLSDFIALMMDAKANEDYVASYGLAMGKI